MTRTMTACSAGLLSLLLLAAESDPRSAAWETQLAAGKKAYEQGDYAEAEEQIKAAVKSAEGFEPGHPQLATSLACFSNVATFFDESTTMCFFEDAD